MQQQLWRGLGILVCLTVFGCVNNPKPSDDVPTPGDLMQSALARQMEPTLSDVDATTFREDTGSFALNFYQVLAAEPGNVFFSPHSISLALAMTYAGARGETKAEMADAMTFSLPDEALHAGFNARDLALSGQADFQLRIVNQLFGQVGLPFQSAFLDTIAENYGAGLRVLNFVAAFEQARQSINAWVEDMTNERIKDLLPAGSITPGTRLVLANAIYFKADWEQSFDEDATTDESFQPLVGPSVTAPFMKDIVGARYAAGDDYEAVALPYKGGDVSMLIIAPTQGHFSQVEARLSYNEVSSIAASLEQKQVKLALPKFSFETNPNLKDILEDLGMRLAFTDGADLSGLAGSPGELFISGAFHKAFVLVDEMGTTAAAATAVVVGTDSMPSYDVALTLDRPFFFAIRDESTGTFLFIGRLASPVN